MNIINMSCYYYNYVIVIHQLDMLRDMSSRVKDISSRTCPSGFLMYVCLSICLSVWFCVSLSTRLKCFVDPQTAGAGVPPG